MAHDSFPDSGQRPSGSDDLEKVSVSWLILQRLSDLTEDIAALRKEQTENINTLRADMMQRFATVDQRFESIDRRFESIDRRFESMERRWMWALGLILVMALGLLAKLLLPGA